MNINAVVNVTLEKSCKISYGLHKLKCTRGFLHLPLPTHARFSWSCNRPCFRYIKRWLRNANPLLRIRSAAGRRRLMLNFSCHAAGLQVNRIGTGTSGPFRAGGKSVGDKPTRCDKNRFSAVAHLAITRNWYNSMTRP